MMRNGERHPDSMFHKALAPALGYIAVDKEIIQMLYGLLVEPGDTIGGYRQSFSGLRLIKKKPGGAALV